MCAEFPDKRLKQERVESAEQNLAMFQHNPKAFLRQSLKMDETGIHRYKFESNRQSAERLEPDESRPKRPKMQQSAGKILACIFWNACDIIFINYLGKWKIVTPKYYAAFLDHLSKVIKNKRSNMAKKNWLFHMAVSLKQPTEWHIHESVGKIEWIEVWISAPPTVFSRSGSQWLLFAF